MTQQNPFWTLGPGKHLRSFSRYLRRHREDLDATADYITVLALAITLVTLIVKAVKP